MFLDGYPQARKFDYRGRERMPHHIKLIILFFIFWCGFAHAENFSKITPNGITIKSVTDNQDHYKVIGISQDNPTISTFMKNIKNSDKGKPDLKKIILNPNGSGKYFEMLIYKKGAAVLTPNSSSSNKKKLLDKKYNIRVIIKKSYFEIDGKKYYSQQAIKSAYLNKKNLKVVVCKEKGTPDTSLRDLLTTFSTLNTQRMDVLPGNVCS